MGADGAFRMRLHPRPGRLPAGFPSRSYIGTSSRPIPSSVSTVASPFALTTGTCSSPRSFSLPPDVGPDERVPFGEDDPVICCCLLRLETPLPTLAQEADVLTHAVCPSDDPAPLLGLSSLPLAFEGDPQRKFGS